MHGRVRGLRQVQQQQAQQRAQPGQKQGRGEQAFPGPALVCQMQGVKNSQRSREHKKRLGFHAPKSAENGNQRGDKGRLACAKILPDEQENDEQQQQVERLVPEARGAGPERDAEGEC